MEMGTGEAQQVARFDDLVPELRAAGVRVD